MERRNRGKQFLKYLKDIQETFFRMENNIISLKYDKLKEDQQKGFSDPENIPELKDKLNEKRTTTCISKISKKISFCYY